MIGLPNGQDFNLAETAPFAPLTALTQDAGAADGPRVSGRLSELAGSRARGRGRLSRRRAANAIPPADITADYGDVGPALNNSHGTFTVVASAKVNIFDGGRIAGDMIQARPR